MKDYRRIAENFARRLKEKYGDRIEQVMLFGSVARGDQNEESDVDILIVSVDDSWDFRKDIAGEALDLLIEEDVYISAKVFTPEELREIHGTLFGENVEREGSILA
ncbi:MAG: nucleotidyltransferase domain-containing protein [Candidatus Thermoplasmatota archaeon]|nr:nucleotidyltransferase domain-containing protein [Candidatus Thermoplasmatota archaeon]